MGSVRLFCVSAVWRYFYKINLQWVKRWGMWLNVFSQIVFLYSFSRTVSIDGGTPKNPTLTPSGRKISPNQLLLLFRWRVICLWINQCSSQTGREILPSPAQWPLAIFQRIWVYLPGKHAQEAVSRKCIFTVWALQGQKMKTTST